MPCPSPKPEEQPADTGAGLVSGSIPLTVLPTPYRVIKRCGDVLLASLGLVLLSPLFLVLALLVRITSPGPAFFVQTRLKAGGKPFRLIKFRSMYVDAEQRKASLSHLNETAGPTFKLKDDPRVTPLGRLLRRTSLDEMPQLWNVLIGDMSLVGPRPPLPSEVAEYSPEQLVRLSVQPGLTCLWQISGRSDVDFTEWVKLDTVYITTMSIWTDIKILIYTVPAVLSARGAR